MSDISFGKCQGGAKYVALVTQADEPGKGKRNYWGRKNMIICSLIIINWGRAENRNVKLEQNEPGGLI